MMTFFSGGRTLIGKRKEDCKGGGVIGRAVKEEISGDRGRLYDADILRKKRGEINKNESGN